MINQIQESPFIINVPVSSTFSAGDVVIDDNVVGVAVAGGKSGTTIAVLLVGVVQLAANNSTAFGFGEPLYWDIANAEVINVALDNVFLGTCARAKAGSIAVVQVLLNTTQRYIQSGTSFSIVSAILTTTNNILTEFILIPGVTTDDILFTQLAFNDTNGLLNIVHAETFQNEIKIEFNASPGNNTKVYYEVRRII